MKYNSQNLGTTSYCLPGLTHNATAQFTSNTLPSHSQSLIVSSRITLSLLRLFIFVSVRLINFRLLPNLIDQATEVIRHPERESARSAPPPQRGWEIQSSAKRRTAGLVNCVPVVAHDFCLALPAAFTQPRPHLLADPCT